MKVTDPKDAFYGMEFELETKKFKDGSEVTQVRDKVSGQLVDIPVFQTTETESQRAFRILEMIKKNAYFDGEPEDDNVGLMTQVEEKVLQSNPVIALPTQWPKPHQTVVLNLPASMYADSDKDIVKVGDVMKTSFDANATMAIAMFLGEVVHKAVHGMEDARPPKKPKKTKDGEIKDPDEHDLLMEELYVKDSFVRPLGERGVLRATFKHDTGDDVMIDVPCIQVLMERLTGKSLDTVGYRMHVFVLDPKTNINVLAEEMMKRIQVGQTMYREKAEKMQKKADGSYCSAIDSTCFRRVSSMSNWAELLKAYFGNSHHISQTLQAAHTEFLGESIPLSHNACKAHLTSVLTLRNALEHPMVQDTCEAQRTERSYKHDGMEGRFPLPMAMHSLSYDEMEPSRLYGMRYPVSIYHRLWQQHVREQRKSGLVPMYSEPTCEYAVYNKIVLAAGKKSKSEQDSMLSAGQAAKDPSMRTLRDKVRSVDILECKKETFLMLRQDARHGAESDSPEYFEGMSEFKDKHIQSCFDMFNRYMEMQDLFSPAYTQALTHLGKTDASDHWGDWFMGARNLDPHANALLLLFHRATRVYGVKRGNNQRQLMLHLFSMYSSAHPHDQMKLNLLSIDSNSTSKSFLIITMARMGLEGTVENLSHITANAFNVTGSRNGTTLTMEEMNPAMLGMGPNGKPMATEVSSNFKNMITNQRTTTISCHIDEFGNRKATTHVQPVRGAIQGALNQSQVFSATGRSMDMSAELSRFIIGQPNPVFKSKDGATLQDLVCGEEDAHDEDYQADFEKQMHTFHAYYIIINMMIGCNVLHKVNHDLGNIVITHLNLRLEENNIEKMTPRMCEMIIELMKVICTWCAIVICTGSEHSVPFRYDQNGEFLRFRPEVIREIEKLLVVNSQHILMAITLLNTNIVPLARQQVTAVLWKYRSHFRRQEYAFKDGDKIYRDPRYDLLDVGGIDALAAFISEHSESDISTQAVRAQLDAMRRMNAEGVGPTRIVDSDLHGFKKSVNNQPSDIKEKNSRWQARIMASPNDRTAGVSNNRFNYVLMLKQAYDPALMMKTGRRELSEDWLANEIADILSHSFTEPQMLLHAGVLRRPIREEGRSELIQSALGVVHLRPVENRGLSYIRRNHISSTEDALQYNTRRVYCNPHAQHQAVSWFGDDHDKVELFKHHQLIGAEPDQRLLPWNLHVEMLVQHAKNPGFFGKQDANAFDVYPDDLILDHDVAGDAYNFAKNSPVTKEDIEEFKKDPSLRGMIFHADLMDKTNAMHEQQIQLARSRRRQRENEERLTSSVNNEERRTGITPVRSVLDRIDAENPGIVDLHEESVKKLPSSVQLHGHLVNETGRRSTDLKIQNVSKMQEIIARRKRQLQAEARAEGEADPVERAPKHIHKRSKKPKRLAKSLLPKDVLSDGENEPVPHPLIEDDDEPEVG